MSSRRAAGLLMGLLLSSFSRGGRGETQKRVDHVATWQRYVANGSKLKNNKFFPWLNVAFFGKNDTVIQD